MDTEEFQHKQIEKITKINRKDQTFLLRYYSKLPLAQQINLEKKKKKIFHLLRDKFTNIDFNILSYSAQILSLKTLYSFEKKFSTKKFENMSLDEIRDVSIIKLQREEEKEYLNQTEKRERTIHYWAVIKQLRTRKPKAMSYEKISQRLLKLYGLDVSHNFLSVLWREIEENS